MNAIEHTEHLIFMGFMGTLTDASCIVQIYNYDYELQAAIPIGLEGKCFTDISLCIDDSFLVGAHTEGFISVINLDTQDFEIVEQPIGELDNIWALELFTPRPEGEPQSLFLPSTNGLYLCVLTPTGQFMYCMESYYEGINVTNAVQIDEDEMLVSIIENDTQMKVCKIHLDTREETIIVPATDNFYVLDISLIPFSTDDSCFSSFFLMHTGRGILLVNAVKGKKYMLSQN